MPLFVQIDGAVVTGILFSASAPDPETFPPGRRFLVYPDGTMAPSGGSTVKLAQDSGGLILDGAGAGATFIPPDEDEIVDPVLEAIRGVRDKQDETLAEVKKLTK